MEAVDSTQIVAVDSTQSMLWSNTGWSRGVFYCQKPEATLFGSSASRPDVLSVGVACASFSRTVFKSAWPRPEKSVGGVTGHWDGGDAQ